MTKHFTGILRSVAFTIAVPVSLLGSVGASSAEGFTPEQRSACTPDAFRLCSSEIPNVSAEPGLQGHIPEISRPQNQAPKASSPRV